MEKRYSCFNPLQWGLLILTLASYVRLEDGTVFQSPSMGLIDSYSNGMFIADLGGKFQSPSMGLIDSYQGFLH